MSLLSVREVVVASADVAASVTFYKKAFSFDALESDAVTGILLGVTGSPGGRLRIVKATGTVATPTAAWDTGARLLGIYSRDMAATVDAIRAAGGEPREPVKYPYGTAFLTELVAHGLDEVWWTIPLAGSGHRPSPALEADAKRLHSELHSAVLVVDDHDAAVTFFVAGGLHTLFDGSMVGDDFERLVGMPPAATLRITFLVGPEQAAARLEIMSFRGIADAADRTKDPVGIQRLVFEVDDVSDSRTTLIAAGAIKLPNGNLRGPAGVELELVKIGGK
jgi:hypothetical protein